MNHIQLLNNSLQRYVVLQVTDYVAEILDNIVVVSKYDYPDTYLGPRERVDPKCSVGTDMYLWQLFVIWFCFEDICHIRLNTW